MTNTESFALTFQIDEFYLELQADGNKIALLNPDQIKEHPYPGLRPFKTSEFQLFKGRDGQAEELIARLNKNHFLAVIGSSGTGKSSLVRAGLIPQLLGGYLQKAGTRWNIAICRPGKDPIQNLAVALSAIDTCNTEEKKDKEEANEVHIDYNMLGRHYEEVKPLLEENVYGILDVKEQFDNENSSIEKNNLLIVVDQFEELFRFNRIELDRPNIETNFVNLLLKASANLKTPIYVIITMRSEFLGDCVKYRGLAEAINEGQYLVPQLRRNQIKEAIEGPIKLAGKKIDPDLVELLINELEQKKLKENLDQLPILQHALMSTYREAMKDGEETEITVRHYKSKKVGGMELALANHAEAKYRRLGDFSNDEKSPTLKQKIAKVVFQALTELGADYKGGRRPVELKCIYAIARETLGATTDEVDKVIDSLRDNYTSFIMPPKNTNLSPELMLDISHESLMRNWERLKKWIQDEFDSAKNYERLVEAASLFKKGKKDLLIEKELWNLFEWKKKYAPNEIWAERYDKAFKGKNYDVCFKEAMYYLINSQKAEECRIKQTKQEEERKLQEAQEKIEKNLQEAKEKEIRLQDEIKLRKIADTQRKEAIRQRNRGWVFLSIAFVGLALASTFLIVAINTNYKINSEHYSNIVGAYSIGNQREAKEKISTALNDYKQQMWPINSGGKKFIDSIISFKSHNFFFDSFYNSNRHTIDTLSQNRQYSFRPENLTLNSRLSVYKNGKEIHSDTAFIPIGFFSSNNLLFAYQKKHDLKVYNLVRNSLESFSLLEAEEFPNSQLNVEFDPTASYIYATINREVLKIYNRAFSSKPIHQSVPVSDTTNEITSFGCFKFADISKVVDYEPARSLKVINLNNPNVIQRTFMLSKTSKYVFPLYKAKKIITVDTIGNLTVFDINDNQSRSFGKVNWRQYYNYKLTDSIYFPIYMYNNVTLAYDSKNDKIIDSILGNVKNIVVSRDLQKILYINIEDSIRFCKYIKTKKIISYSRYKDIINANGFIDTTLYFLNYDPKSNSFNLVFNHPAKGASFVIKQGDLWDFEGQKGDELLFLNKKLGYYACLKAAKYL